MGLDAVELVFAVEEKFGVSITEEEATKTVTVGDLKHLVRAKLDVTDATGRLAQRAFHLIWKNAAAEFGVLRRNLRPKTMVHSICCPVLRNYTADAGASQLRAHPAGIARY